jgi:DNA-binding transcriptional LysR family regulator
LQVEEREAALTQSHGSPRGALRLVSSLAFGNYQLAPIVAEFVKAYPDISVTLIVTDNFISRKQLGDQSYDLAFVMDRVDDSTTSITTSVGTIQWLPCASADYIASKPPILKPIDLIDHNCLSHRSFSPPDVWRFNQAGELVSVPVKGSMFSNSVMVLRAGALAGLGVAILPVYCIQNDLKRGQLVQVLPGFETAPKPVYAIYPHSIVPRKSRLFVEFCRSRLRRTSWPA